MKKILVLLFPLFIFHASQAQVSMADTTANKVATITLKMKYHALIIAFMPDKGTTDAIKYINQVASKVVGTVVDTSISVSVTVPYRLVANMYLVIGSQQERLAYTDNAAIKTALFTQLQANPAYADLLGIIQSLATTNASQTEQIRNLGESFILSVK